MADCPSSAGIHLIVDYRTAAKIGHSPFVYMLSLELCERPVPAALPTQHGLAPEPPPAATFGPGPCAATPAISARRFWHISTRRLIILAAIVLVTRIFVGEASVVPTASMEGTILVGDHLFMDKMLYGPEIPLVHWRLPML